MRKLVVVLFCLALMWISLSGCGDNNGPSNNTYTVSGQITRQDNGLPLEGVTLNFSNGQTITTGLDGCWSQSGLSEAITVTPYREGWAFEPQNRQLVGGGVNANFAGKNGSSTTYTVSGKVSNQSGDGIDGVVLTFDAGFGTATTGSDGVWSKDGLWGRMSVLPAKNGWAFTPVSQNLTDQANNLDFTAQPGVPPSGSPSGLSAFIATDSQATLFWTDYTENEQGFKIELKNGASGAYYQIATVNADIQTYIDSRLMKGITYYYRVRAYNTYGNSEYSNEAVASSNGPPLADTPWPKFRGDLKNTGQSKYLGAQTNHLKWSYDMIFGTPSSPVIGPNGTIYVSANGQLHAINPNGSLKWSYFVGSSITLGSSAPAISADGTIFMNQFDLKLYAIFPNGTFKWSYETGGITVGSPTIGPDGSIYISSDGLYAIKPNGTLKWKNSESEHTTPAISSDGTIYVCSEGLNTINPNGSLKWSYITGSSINRSYSSPAIGSDGTIYFGSNDGIFYALNPNGALKWSYITGDRIDSSPAIAADGTIYVGSNDGKLYVFTASGVLKWSYALGGHAISSPTIGSDGTIYVGGDNIYALNPDGSLKWSYNLAVDSSPAIGSDGTIYVTARGGSLFAFGD